MRTCIAWWLLLGPAPIALAQPIHPALIGHRGLLRDAPENTLTGFAACIELRIGFELDVQRTKDGHLVVLHDAQVDRTTNGKGKVADLTLNELRQLDAGRWFDTAFADQRIPTLEEVFALLRERKSPVLVAMDLKIDDPTVEADMIKLAVKHGVLKQLVFIGRTITEPAVRKKLRTADPSAQVCVLAQTAKDLQPAIDDADANWVYTRFIPTMDEADSIRKAGKKLFLSGPPVNQHEPENFAKAREIRADALLTDFPLECRRLWRGAK
jgi:glycerophosphoryl diester phosphodiesterase